MKNKMTPLKAKLYAKGLTPHQVNIAADLVETGDVNRLLADRACVSIKTVKFHLSAVFKKLKIDTRYELMAMFREEKP